MSDYGTDRPLSDPVGGFTPPRADDDDKKPEATVQWALSQMERARPIAAKWVKMAEECDRFAAGEHFTDADRAALQADRRMAAVFNAAQKWLRFISGVEDSSQIETVFCPRDPNSDQEGAAADLVTKVLGWALDGCDGPAERSRAFNDMIRRGMGWTNTLLNRANDVSGVIELHRVDGMEMLWDPDSEKENLLDAKWVARVRQVEKREACRRWPDHADMIRSSAGTPYPSEMPGESTLFNEKEAVPQDGSGWPVLKKGHIKVVEFQWFEEMPGIYFYDPLDDKDEWMSEEEFKSYRMKYQRLASIIRSRAANPANEYPPEERARLAALPVDLESDRVLMNKYRSQLIIGKTQVACSDLLGKRFTYNCMTGQYDDKQRIWYPFFKILLDPQRYMTKFANQIMEIIVRSSKGGLLIESGAVDNIKQFEEEFAKIGSVQEVEDGALQQNRIKDKVAVQLPQGSVEMFQVCNQLMKEVTGLNPDTQMGMGSGEVAGVTQKQRQGAGLLLLAMEFRSLRRYRKAEALTFFDFLRVIADNRWIRIGGPYDGQAVQLVKQPFFVDYDVILDEGTRDPESRSIVWNNLMQMAPMLSKGGLWLDEFWDYSPLPASERFRVKKSMKEKREQAQKMAAMGISEGGRGKPVSQQEQAADLKKKEAETQLTQAKAAQIMQDMKQAQATQILEGLMQGMGMGQQAAQSAQEMRHDEMTAQSDHARGERMQQIQMLRDERKAEMEMRRDAQKAQFELTKETMDTQQVALAGSLDLEKLRIQNEAAKKKANSVEGSGGK